MKPITLIPLLLTATLAWAQEPPAPDPAPVAAPAAAAEPARPAPPPATAPAPARRAASAGTMDRLDLETTAITGNRELPKVMYVVPWKKADLGDLAGRPANSLLDEVLSPVDRDVFRREVTYFDAVEAPAGAAAAQGETPVTAAPRQ